MKNSTLIACTVIITFSLTAFTYSSWNGLPTNKHSCQTAHENDPPAFFYALSPRASNTITKERMHHATSIADLIPDFSIQENLKNNNTSVRDVKIIIEEDNVDHSKHRMEKGNGNSLSKEQINIFKSTDYSTNFFLEGFYVHNDSKKDASKDRYFNYYMTVVPEQQATYKAGNMAFINFLSTECQPTIAKLQKGNLKSGNISFTVTKAGTISNIEIKETCGYPSVDEKMVHLINQLPDDWNVATNGKGEKVNQTLVFSYGQTGC